MALSVFHSGVLPAQEFRSPAGFPSPPPAPIQTAPEQNYSARQVAYAQREQQSPYAQRNSNVEQVAFRQPAGFPTQDPRQPQANIPNQNLLLQQKLEHAAQLRAQMERARKEQGASAEFAEKAYQAQQAYLAEQAYDEHKAYQKKLAFESRYAVQTGSPNANQQVAQYDVAQANYQSRPNSNYYHRTASHTPNTYSPPVHAAPPKPSAPVSMSFGDQPLRDVNTSRDNLNGGDPISTGAPMATLSPTPQPVYRPSPAARPAPQPAPRLAPQAYTAPASYQQASYRQPAAPAPSVPRAARQAPQPRQQRQTVYTEPDFPAMPKQKVHGPNDPFILGEQPTVGLQDRITNLLTKPRYRTFADRSNPLPQTSQARQAKLFPSVARAMPNYETPSQSFPVYQQSQMAPPRRAYVSPQKSRTARPSSPGIRTARVPRIRTDSEVRLAYEMEQRIQNGSRNSNVRQASMVSPVAKLAPAQDPFNDGALMFPGQAPKLKSQFKSRTPAKQISILSGRTRAPQEQDNADRPFGNDSGGFGQDDLTKETPSEFGLDKSFGERTDEELKRIDDELNRRLKELDSGLAEDAMQDPEEDSRLKEMEDQLEQDLAKEQQGLGDSVLDEDFPEEPEEPAIKPVEKTCDQFRDELLNSSIRDIALDISPPASSIRDQYMTISRSWTDRSGNVIASGAMVDLRRGYVIIEGVGGRQKIPYAKLSEADLSAISDYWRLPQLCSLGDRGAATRNWGPQTYTWKATSLCHKPLFFENVQLERYGHSRGPFSQPVHSTVHFFASLFKVPYKSAISPPNECQYALGYFRPGNCAPWLNEPMPISLDGAKRQVLFLGTGGLTR